jgi:hypothetical protein
MTVKSEGSSRAGQAKVASPTVSLPHGSGFSKGVLRQQ